MVDSTRSTELRLWLLLCLYYLFTYINANRVNKQTQNRRTKQNQGPFLVYYESPSCSCTVDPEAFGVAAVEKGGLTGHVVWADPDL